MKKALCAACVPLFLWIGSASADDAMSMDHMKAKKHGATHASPSDAAFDASMQKMMKGMNVAPSGSPDRDFAQMMLPHHQGAIDMAKVELQYGKDPVLRKLAEDIVKAQEGEITLMKDWLTRNGK